MAATPFHDLAEELHRLADRLTEHGNDFVLGKFTVGIDPATSDETTGAVTPEDATPRNESISSGDPSQNLANAKKGSPESHPTVSPVDPATPISGNSEDTNL